jgi:TfoX/Sxy family transcriptional regulator of competence genes
VIELRLLVAPDVTTLLRRHEPRSAARLFVRQLRSERMATLRIDSGDRMASDQGFVDHLCERLALGNALSTKKLFGEYAVYLDGKIVALVCDNQLFVKPTPAGRAMLKTVVEESPFPNAKPHFLIEDFDDRSLLQQLFQATALALPARKPKAAKRKPSGK